MGIKNLNKFLKTECSESSIKMINLSELSGKKIAVDISIYMYKYASENALIENMYLMLSLFRQYNIIPIFIFDGKPPTEKKELLQKRKQDKIIAEKEYNSLKTKLVSSNDENEKQDIINSMDVLKKQFVYISKEQIQNVKNLIIAYGATYFDAPGEADELCALLVIKKKVWACMSEDMDMFVYGCNVILRYLSMMNHTIICYDFNQILDDLKMTSKEFREVCIISGTDYNIACGSDKMEYHTLDKTLKYYKKYSKMRSESVEQFKNIEFYDWLLKCSNYITNYESLCNIYSIFDLVKNKEKIKIFEKIKIVNGPILKDVMRKILMDDGFIFYEEN